MSEKKSPTRGKSAESSSSPTARTPEEWGKLHKIPGRVVILARARGSWPGDALVEEASFQEAVKAAALELVGAEEGVDAVSVPPAAPPMRCPVDEHGHILPGPSRCAPGRSPGAPRQVSRRSPILGGRRR